MHVLTSAVGDANRDGNVGIYRRLYFIDFASEGKWKKRWNQLLGTCKGLSNYWITRKVLARVKPDVVYAGQLTNISLYPLRAIGKRRIPIVHHLGNSFILELSRTCELEENRLKRIYKKVLFGFSDRNAFEFQHIITVSEMLKKKHVDAGFPEERISVLPPVGIPLHLLKEVQTGIRHFGESPLKLLYVGRLVPEKGVHIAIESVRILRDRMRNVEVVLDIYGEGDESYKEHLVSLARDCEVDDCVAFKGMIPRMDMMKRYDQYHILLVPSIWEEPFGMITIEAFSRGVPVVASRTGGIPEIVEDAETGLLVQPDDAFAIAIAVERLVNDPDLIDRIARNGAEKIRNRYTEEIVIEGIETRLKGVLEVE